MTDDIERSHPELTARGVVFTAPPAKQPCGQFAKFQDMDGVAVLIAAGATLSLIASPGADSRWSQLVALVLCSPAAWAGDWMRRRRLPAAG